MLDQTSRNGFIILGLLKWCWGLSFALQARFPEHPLSRFLEPRRLRTAARTAATAHARRRSLLAGALTMALLGLWILLYPLTALGPWLVSLHLSAPFWLVIAAGLGVCSLPILVEWATRVRR